jgi:uncharacterized protein (DUF305 family)
LRAAPSRAVVACLATGVVGLLIGFGLRRPAGQPSATSVDVRALQDLHYHHDQAVGMSLVLVAKPAEGANPTLRQLARTIAQAQSFESGRMAELLARFGMPLTNDGDAALEWMSTPVPINEMPGLASDDDTAALAAASGNAADRLYVRMMVAHHQGALVMAGYAVGHARRAEVRALARVVVTTQQDDITQLQAIAATL